MYVCKTQFKVPTEIWNLIKEYDDFNKRKLYICKIVRTGFNSKLNERCYLPPKKRMCYPHDIAIRIFYKKYRNKTYHMFKLYTANFRYTYCPGNSSYRLKKHQYEIALGWS